ncbi:MAG: DUF309 domain-containing protein [Isosphaeraceae bacterium]
MSKQELESLPPYSYVPGGRWPHPTTSPEGHSRHRPRSPVAPIEDDRWADSAAYLRGVALFNAGYYWEAHEAWEGLWLAQRRRGAIAAVIQGLIKLAAAGVKIREGRPVGVRSHAARAALLFEESKRQAGRFRLGLDLDEWSARSRAIAENPPNEQGPPEAPVFVVFNFQVRPC